MLIGPGVDSDRSLSSSLSSAVDVIEACNATDCIVFDDRLPSGYYFGNSTTMMMSGDRRFVVLTDATNSVTSKPSNQYFYRSTTVSNNSEWKSLSMIESRYDGCLLTMIDSTTTTMTTVVYGGGRSIDDESQLLSTIELLSLNESNNNNNNNNTVRKSMMKLSVGRARSGCTSMNSTTVMFVGGWTFESPVRRVASDVVDLIDLQTNRVVTSRLSRRVVGASVASLKNAAVVVVTGGVTTDSSDSATTTTTTTMFENAFDYGSINNNAVEQYDANSGEWRYVANALTLFADQSQATQRIAFAFANQVFYLFVFVFVFVLCFLNFQFWLTKMFV